MLLFLRQKSLLKLLSVYRGELTSKRSNTIINAVRRNPNAASKKHVFVPRFGNMYPLHHAVWLGANVDVVEAIYNSYPQAKQEICDGFTVLELATQYSITPIQVVHFLTSKWPEGLQKENSFGTPLHHACLNSSYEVVSLLLRSWPGAARVKNDFDWTPLFMAVIRSKGTSRSVPSLDIISLLIDYNAEAAKEKDDIGMTPLHYAAGKRDASLDLILLLLKQWPSTITEKDSSGKTPLDLCKKTREKGENKNEVVYQVLSFVHQIFSSNNLCSDDLEEMIHFFIQIKWKNGIQLLLDLHPTIVKDLAMGYKSFPKLFSFMGMRCKLKTMWRVLGDELDVLVGV